MDFQPSERCSEFKERLTAFMDEHVYPAEALYERQLRESGDPHHQPPIMEELKTRARERGAVEHVPPRRRPSARGSPTATTRRSPRSSGARHIASEACNCSAPGHRQHGGALPVRDTRAEGALADAAARRRDPLGVRDDRARRRLLGRDQHRAAHRARRRRLRAQRAQVVDLRRAAPPLPDHDRDGQDAAPTGRGTNSRADPRAARHPRRDDRARPARVRLPGPGGPRRNRLRRRARPRRRT